MIKAYRFTDNIETGEYIGILNSYYPAGRNLILDIRIDISDFERFHIIEVINIDWWVGSKFSQLLDALGINLEPGESFNFDCIIGAKVGIFAENKFVDNISFHEIDFLELPEDDDFDSDEVSEETEFEIDDNESLGEVTFATRYSHDTSDESEDDGPISNIEETNSKHVFFDRRGSVVVKSRGQVERGIVGKPAPGPPSGTDTSQIVVQRRRSSKDRYSARLNKPKRENLDE